MARKHDIYAETPIIPIAVADGVLNEVQSCFPLGLPDGGRAMADRLANHAEAVYAANPRFRKGIQGKGNRGRDYLWGFMRHWASAEIHDCCPAVFRQLPDSFKVGHPLKCGR